MPPDDAGTGGTPPNPPAGGGQIPDGGGQPNGGGTPPPPPNPGSGGTPPEGGEQPKFTQADLDRILATRLQQERAKQEKEVEAAKAEAERKRLAEQGEWKTLFETAQKEAADLKNHVASLELVRVRDKVAAKYKLPSELADRLKGSTEAEIEDDAKELAKLVGTPNPPSRGNPGGDNLTKEQLNQREVEAQRNTGRYSSLV